MKERDLYRYAKMVFTCLCAGLGYYTSHTHKLPDEWRVTIESCIAGILAVGLYVTPSPIHASDVPVPVPPDVVEPPQKEEEDTDASK